MHAPDALSVRYIRQSRESGTKMITPCKRIGCIKCLQIGGTKVNIYNLTHELRNALDNIQTDEETGEVLNWDAIDALNVAFESKAEAYAVAIKEYEAMAKQVAEAAKTLAERKYGYLKRAEAMKQHLAVAMAAVGESRIETPNAAISFRRSTAVVVDEAKLPEAYWKITETRKPDKTEVGKLLKQGVDVPGAALETRQNLQVK